MMPVEQMRDLQVFGEFRHAMFDMWNAVEMAIDDEILPHRQAVWQIDIGGGKIGFGRNVGAVTQQIAPENTDAATRGFEEAEQHGHRRAFAGTIAAQQRRDAAGLDGEIKALDRDGLVKGLAKACGLNGESHVLWIRGVRGKRQAFRTLDGNEAA